MNPKTADAAEAIRGMTDGRGAAVALECVGATEPIATAIAAVRKGGTVTLVGNVSPEDRAAAAIGGLAADPGAGLVRIQRRISGVYRIDGAAEPSGWIPLISAVAPLVEGPSWFDRLYRQEPGLMKVFCALNPRTGPDS